MRLLDRNRQGIEPTTYGRALLDCGVAVFDELRQGMKNVEFLADPTIGEIRIGGNEAIIAGMLRLPTAGCVAAIRELPSMSRKQRWSRNNIANCVSGMSTSSWGGSVRPSRTISSPTFCFTTVPLWLGTGEQMGPPPQNRTCRIDQRVSGPTSAGHPSLRRLSPTHSAQAESACRAKQLRPDQFTCSAPFSRADHFSSPFLDRCCGSARTFRNSKSCPWTCPSRPGRSGHDIEGPDDQPGRATLHRVRPRGREAVSEGKITSGTQRVSVARQIYRCTPIVAFCLPLMPANGMVRPCSCPASDRSWQGAPKTRSTPCPTRSKPQSP